MKYFYLLINTLILFFFEKTINMFQDLNNLYFIFYEKNNDMKKRDLNSVTKRIYLGIITNKKTIKKQYKD